MSKLPYLLAGAVTLAAHASGQANANVNLLSRLDTRAAYAGIWGYFDPATNREFAIVGERTATWIVEVTNPAAPAPVAVITGPSSTWREFASYGTHIYSVSEGHSGIRVINMVNPATPVDLGYVHQSSFGNVHSISVDPGSGRLYINGTTRTTAPWQTGMWILDAAANPANPPVLGRYGPTSNNIYVHDGYFRRGRGYLGQIYVGTLRIMDVTNPANLVTIGTVITPSAFTHNAWVTEDDRLLVTTDETSNPAGVLGIYDITNPAAPALQSTWSAGGSNIVHNVFGIGRTLYVAHYSAGIQMVDVSNPAAPRRLAGYDTHTSTSGFNGCWGAYPWLDSGVVVASDISNGLFCLEFTCGHLNRFGTGTAGTGGNVPRCSVEGSSPMVGGTAFTLNVEAAPLTPYVLLIGAQGNLQALGINLYVDPTQPLLTVVGATDASGKGSVALPLGNDPSLGNVRVYSQLITIDAAGPQGLAASRGMWFGICP